MANLRLIITRMALGAMLSANCWAWDATIGEPEAAMTLTPDLTNGLDIFEICATCHTPEGWGTKDGAYPQISGQHRSVLIKQLADIRAKNRDNPSMYPFAVFESIGDEQAIADVTAYIQQLPMNPDHGKGEWAKDSPEFKRGRQLYINSCIKCHSQYGQGDASKSYPRLDGQHYHYMLRQLKWIRDGKRRNANKHMVEQIKRFTDKELQAVSNYISHMPVDKKDLAPSVNWRNPDLY